jgi:hypothetical protein
VAAFEYSDNFLEIVKQLKRAGVALQQAAADTINIGAAFIKGKYVAGLQHTFRIRAPRFTLGAIKIQTANAKRSSGELRKLTGVNARIGVPMMRGGREHYLARQESGGTVRGNRKTGGRVPIPLVAARQSTSIDKPVAAQYRIGKSQTTWAVTEALRGITNPRQLYGAMLDRARRGEIDPKKLYMTQFGIFRVTKKAVIMLRNTEETSVTIRARPVFRTAVDSLTSGRMETLFVISAKKLIHPTK